MQSAAAVMPDALTSGAQQKEEESYFNYGFGMQHSNVIPETFIAQKAYDETVENFNPSKALLDCNPHVVGRKWRLVKKFEREMVCFDEARYLSDNYDEDTLEIVNAMISAEQPFASYLAMLNMMEGMESLSIQEVTTTQEAQFQTTRDEFHLNMAIVFDLAFAIFAEKRFLLYQDYNDQTSPINIIKGCQTLSSFTDPSLWGTPEKRYMAYGVSSLRRHLTFGCFRNYDLGMQALKDIYFASLSLGS